jgi:superfamily II DNA or RNA helicase
MSTRGKSRIICCADDIDKYLCLPRGCEEELKALFSEYGVDVDYVNKTNGGKRIDVTFNGGLRDEQPLALERLLKHDLGVLAGTTAFGKTVVAIKLLAERKVSTLIIVDRVGLISHWKKRLTEFLTINETLPDIGGEKKRGRKKARAIIGQLGVERRTSAVLLISRSCSH